MASTKKLIVILGDQLSLSLSSLDDYDPDSDEILMMEVMNEATYVSHHPHKIILLFSAMRHFAQTLQDKGFRVTYLSLTDKANAQNFTDNVVKYAKKLKATEICITEPGEYRVLEMIESWPDQTGLETTIYEDSRFYCSTDDFKAWADGKKELKMEMFYQKMRKQHDILMNKGKPEGGKFNFDADNRKTLKSSEGLPKRVWQTPDQITQEVIALVKKTFKHHAGDVDNFQFAVTREKALKQLDHFIKVCLPHFGDFQDAMLEGEYYLYHSFLSMYLNCGLLLAHEVVEKAEQAYRTQKASLNNVEGFIRQILGWREFIRGIYWLKMPEYKEMNFFNAQAPLPDFYWNGETDMACMRHAIRQTLETSTSHHIQRLMVTGNFAMLLGVIPEQICDWYLAVYADAFEWVELPNVLGMSQYADGGVFATKPYAASGNYINKMSNHCKHCVYDVKKKLEKDACPFNDLYWAFLIANRKKLESNPRMGFAFKHVNNMNETTQKLYVKRRQEYVKQWCQE